MAHLYLGKKLNLTKATISVWFRIPSSALDAVPSDPLSDQFEFPVFGSVIPILVFGHQPTGGVYDINRIVLGSYWGYDLEGNPAYEFPVYGSEAVGPRNSPMQPTCIGVRVLADDTGVLDVHLQTADTGSASSTQFITTGWVPIVNDAGVNVGIDHYITADASYVTTAAPEFLGNSYYSNFVFLDPNPYPPITFDQWHHLLLSWDLTGGSGSHGSSDPSVDSASCVDRHSLMWCALDDVNKNGKELPAITFSNLSQEFSGNPNAILSYNTYLTAGLFTGPEPDANPIASFNVSFSGDLGDSVIIPSEASYSGGSVEPLQRIELSDLQIFTGVTLDTGSVANRRAFVDANGLPVPPAATAVVVEPGAPPSLIVGGSIELLGKKPEIVLRGSGNWIGGRNTGTLGMDNNGVSIPSGQFIPTGNIIRYVPDPQLSGHSVLPTIRKVQLSKRPVREGVFRR